MRLLEMFQYAVEHINSETTLEEGKNELKTAFAEEILSTEELNSLMERVHPEENSSLSPIRPIGNETQTQRRHEIHEKVLDACFELAMHYADVNQRIGRTTEGAKMPRTIRQFFFFGVNEEQYSQNMSVWERKNPEELKNMFRRKMNELETQMNGYLSMDQNALEDSYAQMLNFGQNILQVDDVVSVLTHSNVIFSDQEKESIRRMRQQFDRFYSKVYTDVAYSTSAYYEVYELSAFNGLEPALDVENSYTRTQWNTFRNAVSDFTRYKDLVEEEIAGIGNQIAKEGAFAANHLQYFLLKEDGSFQKVPEREFYDRLPGEIFVADEDMMHLTSVNNTIVNSAPEPVVLNRDRNVYSDDELKTVLDNLYGKMDSVDHWFQNSSPEFRNIKDTLEELRSTQNSDPAYLFDKLKFISTNAAGYMNKKNGLTLKEREVARLRAVMDTAFALGSTLASLEKQVDPINAVFRSEEAELGTEAANVRREDRIFLQDTQKTVQGTYPDFVLSAEQTDALIQDERIRELEAFAHRTPAVLNDSDKFSLMLEEGGEVGKENRKKYIQECLDETRKLDFTFFDGNKSEREIIGELKEKMPIVEACLNLEKLCTQWGINLKESDLYLQKMEVVGKYARLNDLYVNKYSTRSGILAPDAYMTREQKKLVPDIARHETGREQILAEAASMDAVRVLSQEFEPGFPNQNNENELLGMSFDDIRNRFADFESGIKRMCNEDDLANLCWTDHSECMYLLQKDNLTDKDFGMIVSKIQIMIDDFEKVTSLSDETMALKQEMSRFCKQFSENPELFRHKADYVNYSKMRTLFEQNHIDGEGLIFKDITGHDLNLSAVMNAMKNRDTIQLTDSEGKTQGYVYSDLQGKLLFTKENIIEKRAQADRAEWEKIQNEYPDVNIEELRTRVRAQIVKNIEQARKTLNKPEIALSEEQLQKMISPERIRTHLYAKTLPPMTFNEDISKPFKITRQLPAWTDRMLAYMHYPNDDPEKMKAFRRDLMEMVRPGKQGAEAAMRILREEYRYFVDTASQKMPTDGSTMDFLKFVDANRDLAYASSLAGAISTIRGVTINSEALADIKRINCLGDSIGSVIQNYGASWASEDYLSNLYPFLVVGDCTDLQTSNPMEYAKTAPFYYLETNNLILGDSAKEALKMFMDRLPENYLENTAEDIPTSTEAFRQEFIENVRKLYALHNPVIEEMLDQNVFPTLNMVEEYSVSGKNPGEFIKKFGSAMKALHDFREKDANGLSEKEQNALKEIDDFGQKYKGDVLENIIVYQRKDILESALKQVGLSLADCDYADEEGKQIMPKELLEKLFSGESFSISEPEELAGHRISVNSNSCAMVKDNSGIIVSTSSGHYSEPIPENLKGNFGYSEKNIATIREFADSVEKVCDKIAEDSNPKNGCGKNDPIYKLASSKCRKLVEELRSASESPEQFIKCFGNNGRFAGYYVSNLMVQSMLTDRIPENQPGGIEKLLTNKSTDIATIVKGMHKQGLFADVVSCIKENRLEELFQENGKTALHQFRTKVDSEISKRKEEEKVVQPVKAVENMEKQL